jgi:glutamyl-tRNA reductase
VPPDVERVTEDSPTANTPDETNILTLIDLEDVGAYQREIVGRRCQAAAAGETIVSRRATEFADWLHNQQLGPKMKRLRQETEIALERELDRYGTSLDSAEREELARFGRTLIKRFLGACRRVDDES